MRINSRRYLGRMRRWSLFTAWSLCLLIAGLRSTQPTRYALSWDVFGYYLYLPATVIHNDIALRDRAWLDTVMTEYEPSATLYQLVDGPDGVRVIKYSAGMAIAYAPWFLLAHGLAGPLGWPADGLSPPYAAIVTYGMLLWILLGVFFFRRVLLQFFSDAWTAVLLALTVLGTNWLQLAALDGTLLTHPFLFTLYAGLLLATIGWHARPAWPSALAIGALAGWITVVRPSEGVCLLLPLLWPAGGGAMAKWRLLRTRWKEVLLAAMAFLAIASPQLFYWKYVTGHWLFYSYVNAGEGFDFSAPHTWSYLFSFRKGWFIYTPLALLMVGGLVVLWRQERHLFWPIAAFLVVDLYVVSSWTNWWYAGGSFSARSMMPAYAPLALPLGFALRSTWRRPLLVAAVLCVALNLFQTWQWERGIISRERMTAAYYAAVFGRTSVPSGAAALLLVDRPGGEDERLTDEASYTRRLLSGTRFDELPDGIRILTAGDPFAPGPEVSFARLTRHDHAWLRVSARLFVTDSTGVPPVVVCAFHHNGEAYKYKAVPWDLQGVPANTWATVRFDYITPEVRAPEDNLKVYIWNQHGGTHRVDDLCVELFEPE